MLDLDLAISQVGALGFCQIVLVTFSAIILFLVGANLASSIFEAMVPETRCRSPFEETVAKECPSGFQKFLVPEIDNALSKCERYNFTDVDSIIQKIFLSENSTLNCNMAVNHTGIELVQCTEWEFDRDVMRNTVVSDFNLVCADQWATYFSQSTLMFGAGIGSILAGYMSDRIGRRHALLIVCAGATVSGTALAFTTSYLAYSIVRAIVGMFIYPSFPILFVYTSEVTIPKYRTVVAQMLELCSPFGYMLLAMFAYVLRDWRHLQLVISVPYAAGILLWCFMPESPRWLLEKNREDDAIVVLERIAKINGVKETPNFEKLGGPDDSYNIILDMQTPSDEKTFPLEEKNFLMSIFGMPNIRSATFKMFYNWFAVACVYFGLTLNAAELEGDPFRNVCLNSVAEVVAMLLTIPLVHFCGRRATGCGSAIMAGTMCILVNLVSRDGIFAVSTLGKFAIAIASCALFLHTNELYPTSIRNLGVGLCSAMARVGGIASPLISMSGLESTDMPYIIFGILSITAGIVVLTLPETTDAKLPQTLQEGDAFVASDRGIPRKIYQTFRQRSWQRALLKETEEPLLGRGLQ